MSILDLIGLVAQDAFWSALAAVGFAVLFNVPKRTLMGCALGGAFGHSLRTLLMHTLGFDLELATLAGSTLIGFLGLFFARRWKAPLPIFTVSAAVTMVPGSLAYRTMMGILQLSLLTDPAAGATILVETSITGIRTALILGAIGVGIAAPSLLFFRNKPVV